jgi:hypothetical protein
VDGMAPARETQSHFLNKLTQMLHEKCIVLNALASILGNKVQ